MKINLLKGLPNNGLELENLIHESELEFAPLKAGNEAKIIWANNRKEKTKYSIVYLHGFTASHIEGQPWHTTLARHFGCNLYLARLHSHGLDKENFFEGFNYPALLDSVLEACRIGQKLGENVLLMGTSTGGGLALHAAGSLHYPVTIKGLLLVSPLIHFYGYQALLLENKVGRFLAKIISKNYIYNLNGELLPGEQQVWYPYTPLNAAIELGEMLQQMLRPELFSNVRCPVFTGYYFKDKIEHDYIVSPHAIQTMFKQLGTADAKKRLVNFTNAGSHVICSDIISNSVEELINESIRFLEDVVGITL